MRIAISFLTAILVPTCLVTVWYRYGQFEIFPTDDPFIWVRARGFLAMSLAVSAAHVLILGIPAYVLLRKLNAIRWWSTTAVGFILAAIPLGVLTWPLRYSELRTSATIDGVE